MSTTTTGTHTPTQSQGAGHVYSLALEGLVESTEDTAGRRRIPTGSPQFSVQPRYVDDDTRPTTELATYTRQPGSARWPVAPPSQFPVSPTYRMYVHLTAWLQFIAEQDVSHNPPPRPSRIRMLSSFGCRQVDSLTPVTSNTTTTIVPPTTTVV